jgi:hypothetical protein
VVRHLLLEPLGDDELGRLGEIMARVRDHMRAEPPRSAGARRGRQAAGRDHGDHVADEHVDSGTSRTTEVVRAATRARPRRKG